MRQLTGVVFEHSRRLGQQLQAGLGGVFRDPFGRLCFGDNVTNHYFPGRRQSRGVRVLAVGAGDMAPTHPMLFVCVCV